MKSTAKGHRPDEKMFSSNRRKETSGTDPFQRPMGASGSIKRAIITGVTGQDGSYLAEWLLDQVLKALPRSDEFAYRKAVVEKGPSEILPGERSDVTWISVETPDRQKEVVIAKGMNDSQFQGNPLVTLQHNYQLPPVERSLWCKVARDGDLRGLKAKTLDCY